MKLRPVRAALAATVFVSLLGGAATAQGISDPGGPPPQNDPGSAPTGDRVNAALVLRELRQLGATASVSADSSGEPRVEATVDNYKWAIFFYGCSKDGAIETRWCNSLQFFSGYTMNNPISALTMNKFNSENRYIRAYTALVENRYAARISMDVMFANTGGDPARLFRAHYSMMKLQTSEFRKLINFK
jgi:hypothetical protein